MGGIETITVTMIHHAAITGIATTDTIGAIATTGSIGGIATKGISVTGIKVKARKRA